jgi:hypothetical protein
VLQKPKITQRGGAQTAGESYVSCRYAAELHFVLWPSLLIPIVPGRHSGEAFGESEQLMWRAKI